MLENFYMIAGILGTIIAAVYGLMKYVFYSIDKHKEAVSARLDEHAEKIKDNKEATRLNEANINNLRDEVHKEYAHKDDLNSLSERLDNNFQAVFKKMDAIAKDVNRLIGRNQVKDDE